MWQSQVCVHPQWSQRLLKKIAEILDIDKQDFCGFQMSSSHAEKLERNQYSQEALRSCVYFFVAVFLTVAATNHGPTLEIC